MSSEPPPASVPTEREEREDMFPEDRFAAIRKALAEMGPEEKLKFIESLMKPREDSDDPQAQETASIGPTDSSGVGGRPESDVISAKAFEKGMKFGHAPEIINPDEAPGISENDKARIILRHGNTPESVMSNMIMLQSYGNVVEAENDLLYDNNEIDQQQYLRNKAAEAFCLDENTLVEGGRRIRDLRPGDVVEGQTIELIDRKSDECLKITLDCGKEVVATQEHRFWVATIGRKGKFVQLGKMFGSRRTKNGVGRWKHMKVDDWNVPPSDESAIFSGIVHAEGWFDKGRVGKLSLHLGVNRAETELKRFIESYLSKVVTTFSTVNKKSENSTIYRVLRTSDAEILKKKYDGHCSSQDQLIMRSFLRGFYEGDGYVHGTRGVEFVQNKEWHRGVVISMLKELGFTPVIYPYIATGFGRKFNSVRVGLYDSTSVLKFMQEISFLSKVKRSRVLSTIVSIMPVGVRNVVDINLSGNHEFYANGILCHNCKLTAGSAIDTMSSVEGARFEGLKTNIASGKQAHESIQAEANQKREGRFSRLKRFVQGEE